MPTLAKEFVMPAALQDPDIEPLPSLASRLSTLVPDLPTELDSEDGNLPRIVDRIIAAIARQQESQRLPTATYRIQFNATCTFRQIEAAVSYLNSLGISDVYASPFLQARPHSPHGYDIVNHAAINPEIGT